MPISDARLEQIDLRVVVHPDKVVYKSAIPAPTLVEEKTMAQELLARRKAMTTMLAALRIAQVSDPCILYAEAVAQGEVLDPRQPIAYFVVPE